jgi:NADPH2:quinone reductase
MHALIFDEFGGPEVLRWRETPDPIVPPGHVLVRVAGAGLNFADIYRRRGNYHMDASPPWILGYEGAGTIVAVDEPGFATGDRVAFADSPRANAELVAVPVDKLVPVPGDIALEAAAAVLLQGLTAQYLVRDSHAIRAGEVAVVHAAGGGVGLLLTQLVVAAGGRVIALASSAAKQEAARAMGAADVLGHADWAARVRALTGGRGADVVYDSVGSTLLESLSAARTGGHVVFYGFADGDPPAIDPRMLMDRSLTLTGGDLWNVLTGPEVRRARAAELFAMMRAGRLAVTIAARVPMSDGASAHRLLEGRGVIGKVLLTIGS